MKVIVTKCTQMAYFAYRDRISNFVLYTLERSCQFSSINNSCTRGQRTPMVFPTITTGYALTSFYATYFFLILNHCSPVSPFSEQTLFIFEFASSKMTTLISKMQMCNRNICIYIYSNGKGSQNFFFMINYSVNKFVIIIVVVSEEFNDL